MRIVLTRRGAIGAVVAPVSISGSDDFAKRLSLALRAANLSGAQLSASVGVDKSVVSRWLSGQVQPTSYNLARISAAIAAANPGFNMVYWTAPRGEFEAAIGLSPSTGPAKQAPATADFGSGRAVSWVPWTAVSIVLLLLIGVIVWAVSSKFRPSDRSAPARADAVHASIAVLPFVNMSGDPAKEYLGDGMAEEILNDLANTADLRVAARTSSFAFKGKQAQIGDIARILNVHAVLEGSVRQEGERVRIVAQLINATDGFHIWSARYDRRLDDILAVQDEIARAITAVLTQKLVPKRPPRIIQPRAYQEYLQAQYFFNLRTPASRDKANSLLKDVIARQPDFAAAYALRGHLLYLLPPEFFAESQLMTAKALKLDPENREALYTDLVSSFLVFDLDRLYRDARHFLSIREQDAVSYTAIHSFYLLMGFPQESLEAARRAAERDPLNLGYRINYAQALSIVGRTGEALAADEGALELQPAHPLALYNLCADSVRNGQIERARTYFRLLAAQSNQNPSFRIVSGSTGDWGSFAQGCEIEIALGLGQREQVHRLLDQIPRKDLLVVDLARLYARVGDLQQAISLFSQVYEKKRYLRTFVDVRYAPETPKALLQDPRWNALWRRPLLRDWQRYHDRIAAELSHARPVNSARP